LALRVLIWLLHAYHDSYRHLFRHANKIKAALAILK